jgi:hypothetical protein
MYQKTLAAVLQTKVRPPKNMRSLNWRRFLQIYFANVDADGVANRDPEELAGAALSHLMFAMRRRRGGSTASFRRTPSSTWSTTICPSWSIRSASR